jgi:hypothetical protein
MLGVWLRSDKYQFVVFGLTLDDHDNHYTTEVDHKTLGGIDTQSIRMVSIKHLSFELCYL